MVTRSNVRLGLTGAVVLMIFGAFSGCSDSPTGVDPVLEPQAQMSVDPQTNTAEECVWLDGIIHCAPSLKGS